MRFYRCMESHKCSGNTRAPPIQLKFQLNFGLPAIAWVCQPGN